MQKHVVKVRFLGLKAYFYEVFLHFFVLMVPLWYPGVCGFSPLGYHKPPYGTLMVPSILCFFFNFCMKNVFFISCLCVVCVVKYDEFVDFSVFVKNENFKNIFQTPQGTIRVP